MKDVAKKCKAAKGFQITVNEEDVFGDVLSYVRGLCPNYLIACKEKAPTTGHVHFHVYVQFPNTRRLSLKKLCGAHVEKCLGSPEQNIKYIKKEGDIVCEEGSPRLNYMPSIKQVKDMTPAERDGLPANMYNIIQKINDEEKKYIKGTEYHKDVAVYYVYGESGSGKSKYSIEHIGDRLFNEVKYDGNFWHGVTEDCDIALYDDFRDSHMKPAEFINFIDYNRHIMNVKGGSVRNNYKEIYITSVQSPEEIYKNVAGEPRKQWERRMKCIHINTLE